MTSSVSMMTSSVCVFLALFSLASARKNYQPIAFAMHPPPPLVGPLSSNFALYNAERLHTHRLRGPSEFAFLGGNVYTVTIDGKVVNVATCKPTLVADLRPKICRSIASCGVPTSIRPDRVVPGALLVLDAYRGVFRVNPKNGVSQHLFKNNQRIAGRVPVYLTDFVQGSDGTLLMTDASDKYGITEEMYNVMEGRPSGRIISYQPKTKRINLLVADVLYFPTGLEFTKSEDEVLVTEAGRAVIRSVGLRGHNFRNITVWASNLPGLPTSIRRSARDTYWVSLFLTRSKAKPSPIDFTARLPQVRLEVMRRYNQAQMSTFFNKHGMSVELNNQGETVGSLHDPQGKVINHVSATVEHEGLLYFSSKGRNFVGRVVLPQGDGRVVTVNSAIQVLRSRCQIPEDKLAHAKEVLQNYINAQTGQARGQVTLGLVQNNPQTNNKATAPSQTPTKSATTPTDTPTDTPTQPATPTQPPTDALTPL